MLETNNSSEVRSMNILLVDDVPINLKVLSAMLKKLGHRVETAPSGADAILLLKDHSVDLVMTDLWMLEMNGEELARKIHEAWPTTLVAAITADSEAETSGLFDISAFNGFLTKPVTFQKLEGLLNSFNA